MNAPRRIIARPARRWLALALALPLGAAASELAEWQNQMQAIEPQSYVCRHAAAPPALDGQLETGAWAAAAWTSHFNDIASAVVPRFATRAKLLWNDQYLYVGAELTEPQVWATLTNHDAVIFQDPDFEVFIDPQGSTHNYYEFEINALNTTWDLRLDQPYLDHGTPHNEWEFPGLRSAVQVHGTLNQPNDMDQGWTVAIAFPWAALAPYARHPGPPAEGEQWRMNFSRVEWPIQVTNGTVVKVPGQPEDNWVWSRMGVVDMHRPEMWARVQFTSRPPAELVTPAPVPGQAARNLALSVYHAQRDFRAAHEHWAGSLAELGWQPGPLPPGTETPQLIPTADGYEGDAAFTNATGRHVWRVRQDRLLRLDEPLPVETEVFVAEAGERFGDAGRRAAWFLVDNRPPRDQGVFSAEALMTNLDLALQARQEFPWAKAVPERLFLNDVLPYASLDEPRDEWRTSFFPLAREITRGCPTATAAAQALNRELFRRINVHYNVQRKRNNQSPAESIAQGKSTCTGLAIILVDACRAAGIPARVTGVPVWADKEGNHTWAEFWDGDWHFLGADEYNAAGPDRAWFNADAARTVISTNALNQIYASSWRRTGVSFPLAWDFDDKDVPGVLVSARYAGLAPSPALAARVIRARLREHSGDPRVVARVELRSAADEVLNVGETRPETADLNDMLEFTLPREAEAVTLRFIRGAETREKIIACAACARSQTLDLTWDELTPVSAPFLAAEAWLNQATTKRGPAPTVSLGRAESDRLAALAWTQMKAAEHAATSVDMAAHAIDLEGHHLKWMEKTFGDAPAGQRSLWITLHGGGETTAGENDKNWQGYYGRYEFPPGSINVAPRAPVDAWNMWFVPCVDSLLDRLIADMVVERGVDPNQVYLIGYSAGGDGVYQLAPRLADRLAAATMCAGHPNQSAPDGLRNLPFELFMGGEDDAFHRNTVVREYSARLDQLRAADPDGYAHRCTVYSGLAHNMMGREAEVIPRMAANRRNAWPRRVVWQPDTDPAHARFYWLAHPSPAAGTYAVRVTGQTIEIEKPATGSLDLLLADALVDLKQPIQVMTGGREIFKGLVPRTPEAILQSLCERFDQASIAPARVHVSW